MSIESKTKEHGEIIRNHGKPWEYGHYVEVCPLEDALKAVETHARSRAIEFQRWKEVNSYKVYKHDDTFFFRLYDRDPSDENEYTIENLYELFSHSIDNKQPYTPDQLKEAINTVLGPVKSKNKQ